MPRPRLIHLISGGLQSKRRLALVPAPLRFEKNTLVLAWRKEIDHPTAWLSLDEVDNDQPRFLAYLIAAFQQVDEEIGAPLLSALQSPQLPAIRTEKTNASHS